MKPSPVLRQLILPVALLVAVSVVMAACAPKRVTRMEQNEVLDLSGKWNDTDSRLVAEAMAKDSLSFPWADDFKQANSGKKPTVMAWGVKNRTSEHISTQIFMKDLERSFLRSGRVRLVADRDQREETREERADQQVGLTEDPTALGKEAGANFILTGVLNSVTDRVGGESVVFYQTDLELINVETNEKVWIGSHKIKKFVDRAATSY